MKLTVADKILLHLYRCRLKEGDPGEEQTRMGIAKASQAFDGVALYNLKKAGFVEAKGTATHGRTRRRWIAYALTPEGELAAVELICEIEELHEKVLPLMKKEVG